MGHHKITPFVHALFGDSHVSIPALPLSDDAFGWEVGGGIDYSVGEHIAIRVAEVDFEQARNNVGSAQSEQFQVQGRNRLSLLAVSPSPDSKGRAQPPGLFSFPTVRVLWYLSPANQLSFRIASDGEPTSGAYRAFQARTLRALFLRRNVSMKKAGYFVLLVLFALPAVAWAQEGTQETPPTAPQAPAQTPAPAPPIAAEIYTPQYELSAGYTLRKFYFPDEPTAPTLGMNGGYVSVDRNFKRWLGAYAEISAAYKNRGVWGDSSVYSLLVGPQIYPLKHHKLTPFGHVLFGEGYYRNSVPANGGFGTKVEDCDGLCLGRRWRHGSISQDASRHPSVRIRLQRSAFLRGARRSR